MMRVLPRVLAVLRAGYVLLMVWVFCFLGRPAPVPMNTYFLRIKLIKLQILNHVIWFMHWLEGVDFPEHGADEVGHHQANFVRWRFLQFLFDCIKQYICVVHPLGDLLAQLLKVEVRSFIHLVDQQPGDKALIWEHLDAQKQILVYQLLAGQHLRVGCVLSITALCTQGMNCSAHPAKSNFSSCWKDYLRSDAGVAVLLIHAAIKCIYKFQISFLFRHFILAGC